MLPWNAGWSSPFFFQAESRRTKKSMRLQTIHCRADALTRPLPSPSASSGGHHLQKLLPQHVPMMMFSHSLSVHSQLSLHSHSWFISGAEGPVAGMPQPHGKHLVKCLCPALNHYTNNNNNKRGRGRFCHPAMRTTFFFPIFHAALCLWTAAWMVVACHLLQRGAFFLLESCTAGVQHGLQTHHPMLCW